MEQKNSTDTKATMRANRDQRLKAAMKANMARRKAQIRGRKAAAAQETAQNETQDKAE